jgi:hypothetical protein
VEPILRPWGLFVNIFLRKIIKVQPGRQGMALIRNRAGVSHDSGRRCAILGLILSLLSGFWFWSDRFWCLPSDLWFLFAFRRRR